MYPGPRRCCSLCHLTTPSEHRGPCTSSKPAELTASPHHPPQAGPVSCSPSLVRAPIYPVPQVEAAASRHLLPLPYLMSVSLQTPPNPHQTLLLPSLPPATIHLSGSSSSDPPDRSQSPTLAVRPPFPQLSHFAHFLQNVPEEAWSHGDHELRQID